MCVCLCVVFPWDNSPHTFPGTPSVDESPRSFRANPRRIHPDKPLLPEIPPRHLPRDFTPEYFLHGNFPRLFLSGGKFPEKSPRTNPRTFPPENLPLTISPDASWESQPKGCSFYFGGSRCRLGVCWSHISLTETAARSDHIFFRCSAQIYYLLTFLLS